MKRLNISILIYFCIWTNIFSQVEIYSENFDRKSLTYEFVIKNIGAERISMEAIGIESTYQSYDNCRGGRPLLNQLKSLEIPFGIDQAETFYDLYQHIIIEANAEKLIKIGIQPKPGGICEYWETQVRVVMGFSDYSSNYSSWKGISEDDYFNYRDWEDHQNDPTYRYDPNSNYSKFRILEELSTNKVPILDPKETKNYIWELKEINEVLKPLKSSKNAGLVKWITEALEEWEKQLTAAKQQIKLPQGDPEEIKHALKILSKTNYIGMLPDTYRLMFESESIEAPIYGEVLMDLKFYLEAPPHSDSFKVMTEKLNTIQQAKGFSHHRWNWIIACLVAVELNKKEYAPIIQACMDDLLKRGELADYRLFLVRLAKNENVAIAKKIIYPFDELMKKAQYSFLLQATLPHYILSENIEDQEKINTLKKHLILADENLLLTIVKNIRLHKKESLKTLLPKETKKLSWRQRQLLHSNKP
ncbi:MAG: hypothetical protein AAFO07_04865 [Bacteroidota bacterium]